MHSLGRLNWSNSQISLSLWPYTRWSSTACSTVQALGKQLYILHPQLLDGFRMRNHPSSKAVFAKTLPSPFPRKWTPWMRTTTPLLKPYFACDSGLQKEGFHCLSCLQNVDKRRELLVLSRCHTSGRTRQQRPKESFPAASAWPKSIDKFQSCLPPLPSPPPQVEVPVC